MILGARISSSLFSTLTTSIPQSGHWAQPLTLYLAIAHTDPAGADVNGKDKNGNSVLHKAASEGDTDAVGVLVAAGASTNANNKVHSCWSLYSLLSSNWSQKGESPLHRAAAADHSGVDIISELIKANADIGGRAKVLCKISVCECMVC